LNHYQTHMTNTPPRVTIRQVQTASDRKAYVDLAFRLNAGDPNWAPPPKTEVHGLIKPGSNPWFEHAEAARK
jgi:hypothetical protein